jgi:hypothetical protein
MPFILATEAAEYAEELQRFLFDALLAVPLNQVVLGAFGGLGG